MTDLNKILNEVKKEIGTEIDFSTEIYDYRLHICDDIIEEFRNEYKIEMFTEWGNSDDAYYEIYDYLWNADNITGNASGSYTFSRWTAENNLCHNFDLLREAFEEFGGIDLWLSDGLEAECADVTIRCYLLSECLTKVLNAIYERM